MEQAGDFLGFKFDDKHSSNLNIVRTSDGDRFEEQIIPEVKDISVEVPGMDGEYYFGSTYGPRSFDISIAYDHLTQEDFRKLRRIYGCKHIGELIFDEAPYKKYLAKIESPIELSYICFDEPIKTIVGEAENDKRYGIRRDPTTRELERIYPYSVDYEHTQRIYKGEGKLTFVCYFPFAKSRFKVLPQEYENSDWVVSSGILSAADRGTYNIDTNINGTINIYNAGDVPTGFRLFIPKGQTNQISSVSLSYKSKASLSVPTAQLIINPITLTNTEVGYVIDTNSGLINGITSYSLDAGNGSFITSGNIYNSAVESGYFFKLEPNEDVTNTGVIEISGGEGAQIFYDYLYF